MLKHSIAEIMGSVNRYAESELVQKAIKYDENEQFPVESFAFFADLDILRIPFEIKNDQTKGHLQDLLSIIRTISQICASTASVILTQISFGIAPLYRFGTEEQKQLYLETLLNGYEVGSFALNELESGSDLSRIETQAIETEDGWLLNGSKDYISLASKASIYYVVAKAKKLDGSEGYGLFILTPGTRGFDIGKPIEKMGIKGLPVASIGFDNIDLPHSSLLGEQLISPDDIESIKLYNKLLVAAQSLGIAEGVFERALSYMKKDRRFGQRLIDLPTNQFKMADAYTEMLTVEALLNKVEQFNPSDSTLYSLIKLKASAVAVSTSKTALDLTGGHGFMRNNIIERYVRDASLTEIYGGSSDSQRKRIASMWI